jgi:hypothetical protein
VAAGEILAAAEVPALREAGVRSLELIEVRGVGGNTVLVCLCDCGTVTNVELVGTIVQTQEIAYTCEGCLSSHWMTISMTKLEGR